MLCTHPGDDKEAVGSVEGWENCIIIIYPRHFHFHRSGDTKQLGEGELAVGGGAAAADSSIAPFLVMLDRQKNTTHSWR